MGHEQTENLSKPRPDAGPAQADLASARRVLGLEADGLRALAEGLGDGFVEALDILQRVAGRVIVSGIGKSGHIGCKIAATLASTGTPAHFVHAAEASHGDLGMITQRDAVLAVSYSGETAELADLVAYTRRFAIPLIAITGRAESALAQAADIALILPDTAEACPIGLAPTTSTTMTLALGDTIAVALLERRGFSADDFRVFHPGGRLGRHLLKVGNLMHEGAELPLVDDTCAMDEALLTMSAKGFGCVGVVGDDGLLAGIITDGDLRRHMGPDLIGRRAVDVMTRSPRTIGPQALASEAVQVMNARTITNLFVTDAGKPVGIIHIHDCLRAGVA